MLVWVGFQRPHNKQQPKAQQPPLVERSAAGEAMQRPAQLAEREVARYGDGTAGIGEHAKGFQGLVGRQEGGLVFSPNTRLQWVGGTGGAPWPCSMIRTPFHTKCHQPRNERSPA